MKARFAAIHTEYWRSYYNSRILDGEQWSLTVRYADGYILGYAGSNAYPENWNELLDFFGIKRDLDYGDV